MFVFSSCASVLEEEENSTDSGSNAGEAEVESTEVAIPADWIAYSNEELGVSFRYPAGELSVEDKVTSLDKGKKVSVSTPDFSFVMTSTDFEQGIGEGCCYFLSGEELDESLSDDEIKAKLEKELKEIYNFERISVAGITAYRFIRISQYVSASPIVTVVMVHPGTTYGNVMFHGPSLGDFTKGEFGDKADREAAIAYINNQTYKEDMEFQEKLGKFDMILSTFKFNTEM